MREALTAEHLQAFMKGLAVVARTPSRIYLVGGASAVVLGWRDSTVDVDLKIIPETDELLRSLPRLKEQLHINIELASPDDFIPEVPGWQERSRFIKQEGKLSFYHYDFYAQALAKIERRHERDLNDLRLLIESKLVEVDRLWELFLSIKDQIYRYPELNAQAFEDAVSRVVEQYRNPNLS
jgi:hypothetical protein